MTVGAHEKVVGIAISLFRGQLIIVEVPGHRRHPLPDSLMQFLILSIT